MAKETANMPDNNIAVLTNDRVAALITESTKAASNQEVSATSSTVTNANKEALQTTEPNWTDRSKNGVHIFLEAYMQQGENEKESLPEEQQRDNFKENVAAEQQPLVLNISTKMLSVAEERLSNRGMTFIPSSTMTITENIIELKTFTCNIMLKCMFNSQQDAKQNNVMFHKKSCFIPKNNATIESFEKICEKEIYKLYDNRVAGKKFNLDTEESEALRNLQQDMQLIIRPADKGGPLVVMDRSYYKQTTEAMLNYVNTPRSICSESCSYGYRKVVQLGQPSCCYDCVQCSIGEITNETDLSECLKCPEDHWSNERQNKCIPKAIEFLSYEEPLGATLAGIAISLTIITAFIICVFTRYHDTPIVKANNHALSFLLLVALMFCFLSSLMFIGRPMRLTCMIRQPTFGIIFTLCASCVLSKTVIVVIAFNATMPGSKLRAWLGFPLPTGIICSTFLIQVIICIIWLCNSPPYRQQNMQSKRGVIIIECNEGSTLAFWCMLGYMGLLATVSFIVAFLARNLPGSFNEAKFITFSMVVFVSVWLSFIPAFLSTQGKLMIAVEIFAILSSSLGLLICIFSPKCYIIFMKPEKNTKEYLMGKNK
ncbi:vomeronasal type-2 receptor 26-like [Protopterus annectens]|uniref:vomeronasal type-2 receptor 26-like n=1 Tax=Protopterus annectens TaxID=7888 RepID=UPI001CF9DFEA|nr:vomeronasal type-2 receptor 26-like [Protopterus annectens]